MNTSFRAGALACALLTSTALVSPAFAQTTSLPPVYKNIDENGVDLTDGKFNLSLLEGSVGTGAGELALISEWGNWAADNFDRRLSRSVATGSAVIDVFIGSRRRRFTGSSSATSFTSMQADGSTLTKSGPSEYYFTDADGTVTAFGAPADAGFCATGLETSCNLVGLSTTAASGKSLNYEWQINEYCVEQYELGPDPVQFCSTDYRLGGMSNNAGHSVTYKYVGMGPASTPATGTSVPERLSLAESRNPPTPPSPT